MGMIKSTIDAVKIDPFLHGVLGDMIEDLMPQLTAVHQWLAVFGGPNHVNPNAQVCHSASKWG
jgi:hypothetical protein